MLSALYVSKTGLSAQDTALTTISNNLANVATVGFKRDNAVFQDLLYQIVREPGAASSQDSQLPSGLQLGTGVRVAGTAKQWTQGSMQVTERGLDMAVSGRGMFQVLLPDGTTGYSRDGQFQVDNTGQVVTANGYPLQPAITIPDNVANLTIGKDGIVTANVAGDPTPQQLGQIDLADFVNPQGLKAIGNNLYRETEASGNPIIGTPGLTGLGEIEQGILETSNVDVVEEMVNMITTQRAYEMNSKVVSTADQMLQFVTQNL